MRAWLLSFGIVLGAVAVLAGLILLFAWFGWPAVVVILGVESLALLTLITHDFITH